MFANGIKRSIAFHTAELLQEQVKFQSDLIVFSSYSKQFNVDEDVEDNGDEDNTSKTNSIDRSEPSLQYPSNNSSKERKIPARPLRKSKAFHNKDLLDQQVNGPALVNANAETLLQVKEDEMYQIEMRRKVEEYVQHIYEIKLEHQVELDKGMHI